MSDPASADIVLAEVVYRDGLNRKYLRPQDLRRLSHGDFSSRRAIEGLYSGRHKTFQRGQSIEFRDYRQYIPGDEINHVDWKVYGRTDKLFIKLFEHQTDLTVHLLVDGSHSMFFNGFERGTSDSKYDCCCRLAAAIGFLITKQHDRFSFAAAQDGLHGFLHPGGTINYLMQVLDAMEKTVPTGEALLPKAIENLLRHSKKRDLLCVFSDLLDEEQELLRKLSTWMQRGGEVIVFHVLHEQEIDLPGDMGPAMFIDSENRGHLRVDVPAIRSGYKTQMSEFLRDWSSQCGKLGIDYNLVRVKDSYTKVLEKYFAQRKDRLANRSRNFTSATNEKHDAFD